MTSPNTLPHTSVRSCMCGVCMCAGGVCMCVGGVFTCVYGVATGLHHRSVPADAKGSVSQPLPGLAAHRVHEWRRYSRHHARPGHRQTRGTLYDSCSCVVAGTGCPLLCGWWSFPVRPLLLCRYCDWMPLLCMKFLVVHRMTSAQALFVFCVTRVGGVAVSLAELSRFWTHADV